MEDTLQKPVQAEFPQTTVQEEKKKKSVLFYVNILLLLLVVGLGAYILYKEGYWAKQQEQEMEETEEAGKDNKGDGSIIVEVKEPEAEKPEVKKSETKDYNGEFVKAKLPEGWSIKEYKDGDGTDTVTEGVKFSGLTGLEIKKGDLVVMKLQALEGYGSNSCPEIAHFKDYSQKFEQEMKTQNDEMGDKTTILDFTNTPYTEIQLFGIKTRRVDKTFYYDEVDGDSYFEPQCLKQILVFEDLKYTAGDDAFQTQNGNFRYTVYPNATLAELQALDEILKSMEVK